MSAPQRKSITKILPQVITASLLRHKNQSNYLTRGIGCATILSFFIFWYKNLLSWRNVDISILRGCWRNSGKRTSLGTSLGNISEYLILPYVLNFISLKNVLSNCYITGTCIRYWGYKNERLRWCKGHLVCLPTSHTRDWMVLTRKPFFFKPFYLSSCSPWFQNDDLSSECSSSYYLILSWIEEKALCSNNWLMSVSWTSEPLPQKAL